MPEVRTIFQPDTTIDVSDDEHEVLKANGLLVSDPEPATTTKATAAAQPSATPAATTSAPGPAADTTTKKG